MANDTRSAIDAGMVCGEFVVTFHDIDLLQGSGGIMEGNGTVAWCRSALATNGSHNDCGTLDSGLGACWSQSVADSFT